MRPTEQPDDPFAQTLGRLLGDEALARVLAGRGAHAFVLDSAGLYAWVSVETSRLLDPVAPPVLGAPFVSSVFVPSARVVREVAEALAGAEPEPVPVTIRSSSPSTQLWSLQFLPVRLAGADGARGVLALLTPESAEHGARALDSALQAVTLSERIERERLETAHALAVTIRHEVNNALTSLIGNGELLLRPAGRLDELGVSRVQEILGQAYRIRDVLGQLEALTEVKTTTYLGGVQMIDLGSAEADENEK